MAQAPDRGGIGHPERQDDPGARHLGYDSRKRVKGRQRHLLVDTLGLVLVAVVPAASISENARARLVLTRLGGSSTKLQHIRVDAGYRGTLLAWEWMHLFLKRVSRPESQQGFVVHVHCWVVERTFAWLTRCPWLSLDYEVLPARSEAWMYIAMIRVMIR